MTKTLSAILIGLGLSFVASHAAAQTVVMDEQKLDAFAQAVAKAEGFGVKHTVPTRYHNPGDIRTFKPGVRYPGQIGVNRQHYVIFKDDAAGFAALKNILRRMALGQSKYYGQDMTINNVAKVYATGWRRWAKNVAHNLGVPPTTTLREFFQVEEIEAPSFLIPNSPDSLREILKTNVTMPVLADTEIAQLDFAF